LLITSAFGRLAAVDWQPLGKTARVRLAQRLSFPEAFS